VSNNSISHTLLDLQCKGQDSFCQNVAVKDFSAKKWQKGKEGCSRAPGKSGDEVTSRRRILFAQRKLFAADL
jgi:hypothetical protein